MNLITVSKNVMINPNYISCIEQKEIRGKQSVIVWCDNRSYTVDVNIKSFWNELDNLDITSNGQHFAG